MGKNRQIRIAVNRAVEQILPDTNLFDVNQSPLMSVDVVYVDRDEFDKAIDLSAQDGRMRIHKQLYEAGIDNVIDQNDRVLILESDVDA